MHTIKQLALLAAVSLCAAAPHFEQHRRRARHEYLRSYLFKAQTASRSRMACCR